MHEKQSHFIPHTHTPKDSSTKHTKNTSERADRDYLLLRGLLVEPLFGLRGTGPLDDHGSLVGRGGASATGGGADARIVVRLRSWGGRGAAVGQPPLFPRRRGGKELLRPRSSKLGTVCKI